MGPGLKVLVLDLCENLSLHLSSPLSVYPELTDFYLSGSVTQTSAPLSHERLRCIAIYHPDAAYDMGPFLTTSGSLPSLEEAAIYLDNKTAEHLPGFLLRSKCSLACLGFINPCFGAKGSVEQEQMKGIGAKIAHDLSVLTVEYEPEWSKMRMMQEFKAMWYA
ncbi:hypothetical protein CONPUDRAFT_149662 [Coniophora puteana RWD-64-598 SS2]|uniref:Uncharacterized protein n=1 Tax=Coniophora puteana (strain RWD-64-598) TaxID=741705 RepID=A0A5M3N088_CONPW|nr:uncharacterized protein CONPUDRAFT_149662 [Coniophora puteana RWD-64-598 SS2]EIW84792.1 hypothetical protein CONPUDRAFT_149662 [Coniophora puteana RWD-64-598 SS2]